MGIRLILSDGKLKLPRRLMSINNFAVFANNGGKRYRRVLYTFVAVAALFAFCKSPTSPPVSNCPLYPPHAPIAMDDPAIRIMAPNGGEVFRVGQQCTVKVRSRLSPNGGAKMSLVIGGNGYTMPDYCPMEMSVASMDGDSVEYADHGDSTVIAAIFTVPDSLCATGGFTKISSISNECLLAIHAYGWPYYSDTTDCYFSIVK
jgi:hypothetical protein